MDSLFVIDVTLALPSRLAIDFQQDELAGLAEGLGASVLGAVHGAIASIDLVLAGPDFVPSILLTVVL